MVGLMGLRVRLARRTMTRSTYAPTETADASVRASAALWAASRAFGGVQAPSSTKRRSAASQALARAFVENVVGPGYSTPSGPVNRPWNRPEGSLRTLMVVPFAGQGRHVPFTCPKCAHGCVTVRQFAKFPENDERPLTR